MRSGDAAAGRLGLSGSEGDRGELPCLTGGSGLPTPGTVVEPQGSRLGWPWLGARLSVGSAPKAQWRLPAETWGSADPDWGARRAPRWAGSPSLLMRVVERLL